VAEVFSPPAATQAAQEEEEGEEGHEVPQVTMVRTHFRGVGLYYCDVEKFAWNKCVVKTFFEC